MVIALLILLFITTFLIGSIPWGVIISKKKYHSDIRKEGSGNIGATNALRTLGKTGGLAVFLLDFSKGVISGALGFFLFGYLLSNVFFLDTAYFFTFLYGAEGTAQTEIAKGGASVLCASVAFLGSVLGHIFSPWLKFRGGKGISVSVGAEFFSIGIVGTLIEIAIFALTCAISKIVSLGSILAAIALPFIALWILWGNWLAYILVCIVAVVVIIAHASNIERIASGTENKITAKSFSGNKSKAAHAANKEQKTPNAGILEPDIEDAAEEPSGKAAFKGDGQ